MFGIGMQELIIIAIIALLVVGPKKLPDLAKTLGKTFGELRKAADGITDELKQTLHEKQKDNDLKDSLLLKKTDAEETKQVPSNKEADK